MVLVGEGVSPLAGRAILVGVTSGLKICKRCGNITLAGKQLVFRWGN